MTVYFVGAGPGDPELLTVKAMRLIEASQFCIYAGSLVSPQIVALLPETAQRYDSASLSLEEIIELIERAHKSDMDVVRLHTGDPSIYGAIAEQMDALDRLRIDYEVVPGVSAFQAAAASLKVELTIPQEGQTVILGRIGGRTPVPDEQSLERLGATRATLCLFLSVHKLSEVVERLEPFYGTDCPAAVVYRASWPEERVIRGRLSELVNLVEAFGISRTALIFVGRALDRDAPRSKLYDPSFAHGYRKENSCP